MIRFSKKHQNRTILIIALVLGLATAVGLTLFALQQNINLFFTPSDLLQDAPKNQMIRMGGIVVPGSVKRSQTSLFVEFQLTDTQNNITVHYTGILPDLFREDQGIVVLGKLQPDNTFLATEVLAKHDENYMPPEVMESLKRVHVNEAAL
ncbi:MAG: cytochrome c maturation protein CcmE [Gammaproteobacteria bacterium]|jgi:cytochrome c-type biogenesis protein CcmE